MIILFIIKKSLPRLHEVLVPMQPVRCFVTGIVIKQSASTSELPKKVLSLSLRSSLVNRGLALKHMIEGFPLSGAVSSIEDHG